MNLGLAIKDIRKAAGLSQQELAKLTRSTQATVSQIESGKSDPSNSTLRSISAALSIPISLIYAYGMEKRDCPSHKGETYDLIMPIVRQLILSLVK